jgi:hypothetical protein
MSEATPKRRGTDILHKEELTAWQVLRRHIIVGSWFGMAFFAVIGIQFGFYLGGYGGAKFFEVLFLMDLTGPVAALTGSIIGIIVGTLSVWAILIIISAFCGALVYWLKYRSFPSPPK